MARDIEVTIEGTPVAVDPAAAGLSVDYDASVAEAGGERSWDPVRLWDYFTGGDTFQAVTTVDEAAFAAYLAGLDEQHGATARDGAVTFDGGEIVTTKAREGKALDPDTTRAALEAAFLDEDPSPVALENTTVVPDIDATDVRDGAQLLRLARRGRAGDAQLRGIRRQGLPGRLHRGAVARAHQR